MGEIRVFFKAQGTFKGSKPAPHSPYQTATPFFSNAVLGQQVWPEGTTLDYLHHRLSVSLNDRHNRIGIIGDWMDTHSPQFNGFWSYTYQVYEYTKGQPNRIIFEDFRESSR